ncbi:N-terminal glutamine amidase-domain-containing protein [Lyophyllum atratum]|nr:N-terminal glutamine amidase-domain-containing protein [Lyophyllum atratum]
MNPPSLPTTPYTSCYCEENVYLLAQNFHEDPEIVQSWRVFVVFVSNRTKTVALWNQKLAREPHYPVVWDYHVVLLLRRPTQDQILLQSESSQGVASGTAARTRLGQSWIYDFDTQLELPCPLEDYLEGTFMEVPPQFESLFRIIPSEVFLEHFASDRSHMLVVQEGSDNLISEPQDNVYISPPPPYEPIRGNAAVAEGVTNNLMSSFVSMLPSEERLGDILDRNAFAGWS